MEEGIFRKSGSQSDIMQLREEIERENGILSREMLSAITDCHNVTGKMPTLNGSHQLGLLKCYIRELPGSPVPSSMSDQFLVAVQMGSDLDLQLSYIKDILKDMSSYDYELMKALCEMLHFISTHDAHVRTLY